MGQITRLRQVILFYVLLEVCLSACTADAPQVFHLLSQEETGITFNNLIEENDEDNVFTYMNIYTGAGVAAGDINNDGLTDLYFSGNQVSGRLYLNKGGLKFEDITGSAGLITERWGTGTIMADINQDDLLDIYVCVSGRASGNDSKNLLYINNGNNTFTESADAYGLAEQRQIMHAAVFDYDRDGDLDMFMIVNPASYENNVNVIQPRKLNGEGISTDVLYRNNGDNTFTDISRESGILVEGYSLGLAISDINNDLWPDIYISNDFIGNDVLYVNNKDGTFTNRAKDCMKHTSFAGMGNDIADANNDGLVDIIELDMRPEDNKRQKLIIPPSGYDKFVRSLNTGYEPQYTRNTFQLNRGNGKFSEIAFLSGISSTDWSWSALLADYDNDGDKDLFVTNGFLRDLGNLDYITYQNVYNTPIGTLQTKMTNKRSAIKTLESASLNNYIFENNGSITFSDRSKTWGIHEKTCSHGAVYADLDNDGDLELVINNMNGEAHVYENKSNTLFERNYLKISLLGTEKNRSGIGAKIKVKQNGKIQVFENFHSRGFESSVDQTLHVGLDTINKVDTIEVIWPDGKYQLIQNVHANQHLKLKHTDALEPYNEAKVATPLLKEVTSQLGITYSHSENEFIDFKVQPLLPHMHSRNGPGISVGDVNGDSLEDFYVAGSARHAGMMFLQNTDGKFTKHKIPAIDSLVDQMGVLLFDADRDEDLDLYVVSGGTEHSQSAQVYQDHLYLNDGSSNFELQASALPDLRESGSCVVAADYDKDGDLDLFIGGRIIPGQYPLPASSSLLRNDTNGTTVRFTDATSHVAPELEKAGMVTSALWSDYDNDGWIDLIVAGEFMPVQFYHNEKGKLMNSSDKTGLNHISGWWNSLLGGDFDLDGDTDYLAGNLGINTRYRGTAKEPICVYTSDFDKNGSLDPVMSYYVQGEKHIAHSRDELISQISAIKGRFKTYLPYAEASFEKSFLPSELEKAYVVCSEWFETSYIENLGQGKFAMKALPLEAQFAPVFGMLSDDLNEDGHPDVLLIGNSYATEVNTGRYDASMGLYLYGDGKGNFYPMEVAKSGFEADYDGKALVRLNNKSQHIILTGNNSGPLKAFSRSINSKLFHPASDDAYAIVALNNGKTFKVEFYYGSSYLSQSSRSLLYTADATKIIIFSYTGERREINIERF